MLNSELEALGLQGDEIRSYWQNKTVQEALNKADSTNRAGIKTVYATAISQLNAILSLSNPTLAQVTSAVKQEAQILKYLLLYLKSDLE